jgi:glucuronate isomerase
MLAEVGAQVPNAYGLTLVLSSLATLWGCRMCDEGSNEFLGGGYLLDSASARKLYDGIGDLPIVDAHSHADIVEIVENRPWSDIWQVEGATDHYVWQLMRKRGVPEEKITGGASNRDKWQALAEVFPQLVGNPTYEWIHLDLKRRFGLDEVVRPETADTIWERTSAALQQPEFRPQAVLEAMKVEIMCTTDDPTVHLPFHERALEEIENTRILPTWRPDKAINIENETWRALVDRLAQETDVDTSTVDGFLKALQATHDVFDVLGCVASDHGLTVPWGHEVDQEWAARIHLKAIEGGSLSDDEIADYHGFMLHRFAEMNAATGWVMQLHIGAIRDYRDALFEGLGPDTGGDISDQQIPIAEPLREFFNAFDGRLEIVLYSVDPTHQPTLATIARAYPTLSLGAPWWWNDSPHGMENQLRYMATVGLLANHAGMVTDSRKLISFGSRTEMFRRVLCKVVGDMVERGQMPRTEAFGLVQSLAYERPKKLFFER